MLSKKNKTKKYKVKKHGNFFVRFMAVIWSIIIVVFLIDIYKINHYDRYRYSDAEYTIHEITAKRYATVYDRALSIATKGRDVEEHHEYDELIAMKDYIGASGQYKLYEENNMPEQASYYKNKMESAKNGFGDLSFAVEEIDGMFE